MSPFAIMTFFCQSWGWSFLAKLYCNLFLILFQAEISPFLQEVFMPLVSTIFSVLNQPSDSSDQDAKNDRRSLQKSYYQFLATIVTSNVLDVLKNQGKASNACYRVQYFKHIL